MKIFVAGGTGVLGVRLVPLLVDAGHDVVATTAPRPRPRSSPTSAPRRSCATCTTASASHASRFLAQSIAWRASNPTSVEHLERAVLDFGGVVLRYGLFHGPGTWARTADDIPDDGPKVSIDHAATPTVAHLTSPTGIYTVVD